VVEVDELHEQLLQQLGDRRGVGRRLAFCESLANGHGIPHSDRIA